MVAVATVPWTSMTSMRRERAGSSGGRPALDESAVRVQAPRDEGAGYSVAAPPARR